MSVKVAKKPASNDNILDVRRQQVEALELQCRAVQRMLGIATHQRRRVEAEYADVIRQIAEVEQENEETLQQLNENVKTMKTMSKLTEEQLKHRLETVQKGVAESRNENHSLKIKMNELKEAKERELKEWTDAVDMQQQLIEEKALVFGMQLKNALDIKASKKS